MENEDQKHCTHKGQIHEVHPKIVPFARIA